MYIRATRGRQYWPKYCVTDGEGTQEEECCWQGPQNQDLHWDQKQPFWGENQQEEIWSSGEENQARCGSAWCVSVQSH